MFSSIEALMQVHFTVTCVSLSIHNFSQNVSCWSSASGSGRTDKPGAGTHAIRHNQQVTTPVSQNAIDEGTAVQHRHPELACFSTTMTGHFFNIIKPAAVAVGELLHIREEDINRWSLLR